MLVRGCRYFAFYFMDFFFFFAFIGLMQWRNRQEMDKEIKCTKGLTSRTVRLVESQRLPDFTVQKSDVL